MAETGRVLVVFPLCRGQREAMHKDGSERIARVFCFMLPMDAVYQIIVLRFVYPGGPTLVALTAAAMQVAKL